jgi:hypothetical protein
VPFVQVLAAGAAVAAEAESQVTHVFAPLPVGALQAFLRKVDGECTVFSFFEGLVLVAGLVIGIIQAITVINDVRYRHVVGGVRENNKRS